MPHFGLGYIKKTPSEPTVLTVSTPETNDGLSFKVRLEKDLNEIGWSSHIIAQISKKADTFELMGQLAELSGIYEIFNMIEDAVDENAVNNQKPVPRKNLAPKSVAPKTLSPCDPDCADCVIIRQLKASHFTDFK